MTGNDRQEPVEAVDARIFRPGVLRCAKCGFRLVSNTLWAGNGAVTPRDTTEHCPNDGAPMWRVSWEEECRESDKCWEQQVERAVTAEALLKEARQYVTDALEAHEHSDGRNLLSRIDNALSGR